MRGFRCGKEGSNEYWLGPDPDHALAGHADELIEELTLTTGGSHQFFGGGAGDDANFRRTQVFAGKEIASDAAVALEALGFWREGTLRQFRVARGTARDFHVYPAFKGPNQGDADRL